MGWAKDFYTKQVVWGGFVEDWAKIPAGATLPKSARRVSAVERLAGTTPRRILELGAGAGLTAAALARAGHYVTAVEITEPGAANIRRLAAEVAGSLSLVEGDFYEVDLPGPFEVVCYFDGFGIGEDEDQRRLLRRVAVWLAPGGSALIDVLTPWYWASQAGTSEEWPDVPVENRYDFDAEGSRMIDTMWQVGDEANAVSQTIRCYSPADLQLLLEGTGLALEAFEPYADETYEERVPLERAMLFLAVLSPFDAARDAR